MVRKLLKQPLTGVREMGDTLIVDVEGDLVIDNYHAFVQELVRLGDGNFTRLAINLSQVTHMDSSGLGALAQLLCSLRKSGQVLCLVEPSPKAAHLLHMTGMNTVLPVLPTEGDLRPQ